MEEPQGSPKRRSRVFSRASVHAGSKEDENDDEAERAAYLLEDQRRATSQFSAPRSSTSSSTTPSINSPQKEHFQGCLKLYAENKINKGNAWNLQLIDFMTAMLRKHDSQMENLQMASTTLDASARIYSFRVDAVYDDALKMAGGLSKVAQARRGKKPDGEDDNGAEEAAAEGDAHKKKEKRKKTAKGSVATNVEHQLNGEVEINECIDPFFAQLAATTGDMTSSNRAFNATLPLGTHTLGLILRSDVPFLEAVPDKEEPLHPRELATYDLKSQLWAVVGEEDQLCTPFHGFSIQDWDPEDEEANAKAETTKWINKNLNLSQQAMAFDLDADVEPMPDDNDAFFNDDHHADLSDEEELEAVGHAIKWDKTKMVAHLVDMRPSTRADGFLEYSYSSAVIGSWAGPAHWKLKNNINKVSRAAESSHTNTAVIVRKAPSRNKVQLDFLGEGMMFNRAAKEDTEFEPAVPAKIMIGRKTLSHGPAWNEKNFKTPIDRGFNLLHFRKFYLKKSVVLQTLREEQASANLNEHQLSDLHDYDYNNDNDTSYCPNSQPNEGDDADGAVWPEEGGDVHHQNMLDNGNTDMVEPPAKVAKIFIPYAMRAKKVDMKQLKNVTWKLLTQDEEGANKENNQNGQESDVVKEINFSQLMKKLPARLSTNMKESLSISLSLLAVLHLANEKNLVLTRNPDNTDFTIGGEGTSVAG